MKPGSAYGPTEAGKAKRAQYRKLPTKPHRVASFTYYGRDPSFHRTVRLYQNQFGTYTVDIEGMPSLTFTTDNRDKAEEVFRGWWEFAQKDWGASEIDWGDW